MSKYIIEIDDEPFIRYECFPGEEKLYIAKGFKSLVFDENGLEKLTPYEDHADEAEKAWALARWAFSEADNDDLEKAFPHEWNNGGFRAIMSLSYDEAREKYELWQKKQKTADDEIKVGDEVRIKTDPSKICIITNVTKVDDRRHYSCMKLDGLVDWFSSARNFEKTGRHFPEVAELLKKIGET